MTKLHQLVLTSLSLAGVSLSQIFAIPLLSQQKAIASSVPQNLVSTVVAQGAVTADSSKRTLSKQHLLARVGSVSVLNTLSSQESTGVFQSQGQSWESGVKTSFIPSPPTIPAPLWLAPLLGPLLDLFLNQQQTVVDPIAATISADRPLYTNLNNLKNEGKAMIARGQGDERGCFAAYLDTPGRSVRERAFINALTGRPDEFVIISNSGEVASFDGRRPGTSQVLELKDPGNETRNYLSSITQQQLNRWDQQRAKELRVANACGYQLIGISSNSYLANFLIRRWKGIPPYYYIKAPRNLGLTSPQPLTPCNYLNPCETL